MIPFFSFQGRNEEISEELLESFEVSVNSGLFIGGPELESFEYAFAEYLGGDAKVVGVGNGLDALRIILLALGIGPGDEVIVPAFTFVATWLAVSQTGATLVPVDICLDSANIDAEEIRSAISPQTKAIIVVHLFGRIGLTLDEIQEFEEMGIRVIEDAAQAHGAEIDGKHSGTLGTAGAFSFYPTKNLGCLGDGGAITTSDVNLGKRCRQLSNYGAKSGNKYLHELQGWNTRLDPIQASFLKRMLPHLDRWNAMRQKLAARYKMGFEDIPDLVKVIGHGREFEGSVWHHFVIRVSNRDEVIRLALEQGVQLDCHYPYWPGEMPAFSGSKNVQVRSRIVNAPQLAQTVISLPIYPHLKTSDQDIVIEAIRSLV